MQSQHQDWLAAMRAAGKGGVTLPQIDRGLAYALTLKIPLDVSADSFAASLRLAPDAAGATLADFTVSVGSWDGTYTPVTFSLTKTTVDGFASSIPDGDGNGLAEAVIDVLRTPSGEDQYRYLAGNIYISGKVTPGA